MLSVRFQNTYYEINNNKVLLFVDAASPLEPRVQYIRRGFEQWHFIADCRGIVRTNWS